MSGPPKRSGSRALVVSVVLGILALAGGAGALLLSERSVMAALAISACVAFASMIAALVSFGGRRPGASLGALAASLVILLGLGAGFGAISVQRFVEAVEEREERTDSHADESYRFRLTAPTRTTVLYSERALRAVHERAVAGMWLPEEDVTVLVFVELPYDRSLEASAREDLRLAFTEEPLRVTEAPVRYLDREAFRIQRTFARDHARLFEESTFFLDRGHVYCVSASATLSAEPESSPWFPQALEAFEPTEGEVVPRFDPRRIALDDGPGHRVRDALYENGDFGVRVRGDDRLLLYGDAARVAGPDAILMVVERHPDRVLLIAPVHTGGGDPLALAESLDLASAYEPDPEPPVQLSVSGQSVAFAALRASPDRTWRYRRGVWTDAERVIEIVAWAPTRALVDEALEEMVSRVEILDTAETLALRAELMRRADPWHGVGHDWAARDGVLRDFAQGVRWTRPDPAWSAHVSDVLDAETGFDEVLLLDAPSYGLVGHVIARPARETPAPEHHADRVAEIASIGEDELSEIPAAVHRFGGFEGRVSSSVPAFEHTYAIATVVGDGNRVYHVEVWGTRRDFDAHATSALAAVQAFELHGRSDSSSFEDGVLRDERMGYAFRSPWPEEPETQWTTLGAGVGSLVHFAHGAESIAIIAAPYDPSTSPEAQTEELLLDYYADVMEAAGAWRETETTLGGRSARVRTRRLPFGLGATHVHRLVDRGVLYVLMLEGRGRTSAATVTSGFSLL